MSDTDCDAGVRIKSYVRMLIAIAAIYMADCILFVSALRWHVLGGYPEFVQYSPVTSFMIISATHLTAAAILLFLSCGVTKTAATVERKNWRRDRLWLVSGVACAALYMILILLDDRRGGVDLVGLAQAPYLGTIVIGGVNYIRSFRANVSCIRSNSVLASKRGTTVTIVVVIAFRWIVAINMA